MAPLRHHYTEGTHELLPLGNRQVQRARTLRLQATNLRLRRLRLRLRRRSHVATEPNHELDLLLLPERLLAALHQANSRPTKPQETLPHLRTRSHSMTEQEQARLAFDIQIWRIQPETKQRGQTNLRALRKLTKGDS